jgi:hypothetical protein
MWSSAMTSHRDSDRDDGDAFEGADAFQSHHVSPEFLRALESTVLAAGKYVVPSDNLRPITLEAARDLDSEKNSNATFARAVLSLVILGFVCIPLFSQLAIWREQHSPPTTQQIFERVSRKNIGLDWGLIETINEMRKGPARS